VEKTTFCWEKGENGDSKKKNFRTVKKGGRREGSTSAELDRRERGKESSEPVAATGRKGRPGSEKKSANSEKGGRQEKKTMQLAQTELESRQVEDRIAKEEESKGKGIRREREKAIPSLTRERAKKRITGRSGPARPVELQVPRGKKKQRMEVPMTVANTTGKKIEQWVTLLRRGYNRHELLRTRDKTQRDGTEKLAKRGAQKESTLEANGARELSSHHFARGKRDFKGGRRKNRRAPTSEKNRPPISSPSGGREKPETDRTRECKKIQLDGDENEGKGVGDLLSVQEGRNDPSTLARKKTPHISFPPTKKKKTARKTLRGRRDLRRFLRQEKEKSPLN